MPMLLGARYSRHGGSLVLAVLLVELLVGWSWRSSGPVSRLGGSGGSRRGHSFPTFLLGLVRASRRVRAPRGAGCGCHSFALCGSRRLAARHPATTRLLIENCEVIAA
jgi:hypothetical protein